MGTIDLIDAAEKEGGINTAISSCNAIIEEWEAIHDPICGGCEKLNKAAKMPANANLKENIIGLLIAACSNKDIKFEDI